MGYLLAKVISRDDTRGNESDGTPVSGGVFAGLAQFKTLFDSMLRCGGFSSNQQRDGRSYSEGKNKV
jgi:hypothetical protein